jgi:hypothetical protein
VRLHLLQQLFDLNQAFENVIRGLERMEKLGLFNKEDLRYARAEIQTARADTNREFIDKLGEIVERDATLAYEFCWRRDHKTKTLAQNRRREDQLLVGLPVTWISLGPTGRLSASIGPREQAKLARVNSQTLHFFG